MQRRSFIGAILCASVAPAIVRAESLMKIHVPSGFTGWAADAPYRIAPPVDPLTLEWVSPSVARINYDAYVEGQMRAIAEALGLSYKQLGVDLQNIRYFPGCVAGHNAD